MNLKLQFIVLFIMALNVMYTCSSLLENVMNDPNFNPIFSIKFTTKRNTAICEAHGLLPVTYTIKVLNTDGDYSIDNNVIRMQPAYTYVIICEGKISFVNSTWTKTILISFKTYHFVRLFYGNHPNEGLIQFYHKEGWHSPCDDNFQNDTVGRLNGDVVCRELGFIGVDLMKSDGTFGGHTQFYMDDVHCTGHEVSLLDCRSSIGPDSHNCNGNGEMPAGVICQKRRNSKHVQMIEKSDIILKFEANPSDNLDINQLIKINCISNLKPNTDITFEMWHKRGSKSEINLLNDAKSKLKIVRSGSPMEISYTHTYRPNKEYANDTFICMVKHVTGRIIDRKKLFLEYKYPIEYLIIETIMNETTIVSNKSDYTDSDASNSSMSQYPSINGSSNTDASFKIVSQLKCSGNYESDSANFSWTYTGKNGTNYFTGRILDLNKVEKRLPICCRIDDEMRSGPYNLSRCTTLQELPETPILKTSTFCGTRTLEVECPEPTDMVFSSIHAGYVTSCSETKYDICQHHTVTTFIQEERCEENSCRIFAGLFKKSYFKQILVNLPSDCLKGTKPFIKMDYYCLNKYI